MDDAFLSQSRDAIDCMWNSNFFVYFREKKCDDAIDCADASDELGCHGNDTSIVDRLRETSISNLRFVAGQSILYWDEPKRGNQSLIFYNVSFGTDYPLSTGQ